MSATGRKSLAVCVALLVGGAAAAVLDHWAPYPSAEVSRGSEEPFCRGLFPRELPPRRPPLRWTTRRATVRFRKLPPGPATLEVRLRGHRGRVRIAASGVLVGSLEPGEVAGRFALPSPQGGSLDVEISSETFRAGDGRELGTLLERVELRHAPASRPRLGLLLSVGLPAAAVALAGLLCGLSSGATVLVAGAVAVAQCAALWPHGVVRSAYASELAIVVAVGALLAAACAAAVGRAVPGSAPWAFCALLVTVAVQGVVATSPLMVVSDAVFHANKLAFVAAGRLFPTSVTQHAEAFRFPYGVSFYALLTPLARMGLDRVLLVRWAAAISGVAASAGLLWLLAHRGAARAATAVVLLQLLPVVIDVHSFGNLSNVFGQSLTSLFFVWWASSGPGGWIVGAGLLSLGALAHLSSLIVLLVLVGCLAALQGRSLLRDRRRLLALAVGVGLAAAYYLNFAGLVLEQLPRLLEGGGRGGAAGAGIWVPLWSQVQSAVWGWGPPAILLALVGWSRPSRGVRLERDLTAYWLAGGLLALAAVFSPLEVRYVYALTLPLAVAGSLGFHRLASSGRRGGVWLASILLCAQAGLGAWGIVRALLFRYRP